MLFSDSFIPVFVIRQLFKIVVLSYNWANNNLIRLLTSFWRNVKISQLLTIFKIFNFFPDWECPNYYEQKIYFLPSRGFIFILKTTLLLSIFTFITTGPVSVIVKARNRSPNNKKYSEKISVLLYKTWYVTYIKKLYFFIYLSLSYFPFYDSILLNQIKIIFFKPTN